MLRPAPYRLAPIALISLLAPLGLAACSTVGSSGSPTGGPARADAPVPAGAPRLVLFVVVDQMRADYLERFRPLLEGGLLRLLEEGVVFAEAHHAHADTTTAPGHATLATGAHPSSHGIIGNYWYDRAAGERVYSAGDAELGRSARRLLRSTLAERMERAWPSAKTWAVGGKDRSALLTLGAGGDGALWYDDETGAFVTSGAHPELDERPPQWLRRFNGERRLDTLFGTAWEPLRPDVDLERYGVRPLERGPFTRGLPRALGDFTVAPDEDFYSAIYASPFVDEHILELSKALIEGEALGQDTIPDFLGVTLSALDAVGHGLGPDAPETLDVILRLDRNLGAFLDFVDETVGLEHVAISLSSDHGVGRVPELRRAEGLEGARFGVEHALCIQRLGRSLEERHSLGDVEWMPALRHFDDEAIEAAGADPVAVRRDFAAGLAECPNIERVARTEGLEPDSDDPLERAIARAVHPDRSPPLFVVLEPETLATSATASHGTPWRYDTWVPWILWRHELEPRRIEQEVQTVDVAVTLATMLGLELPEADGVDRSALLD